MGTTKEMREWKKLTCGQAEATMNMLEAQSNCCGGIDAFRRGELQIVRPDQKWSELLGVIDLRIRRERRHHRS